MKSKFLKKIFHYFFKKEYSNNKIILIKQNGKTICNPKLKNLKVVFKGNNNLIEIYEPYHIKKLYIKFRGNNNKFKLGKNSNIIQSLHLNLYDNSEVIIGNNFSCQQAIFRLTGTSNTRIKIGNDCMLSYDVIIRTTDSHTVYDINTKELLNPDKNVIIGNHVWIAAYSKIMKGAIIPDNCIVAAGSLVNKSFSESNSLIAGSPAKVTRNNVNWDKCLPSKWEDYKQFLM